MKTLRSIIVLVCLLVGPPSMACTIFCFTHNGNTYFCNNEDWKDPATMIRFIPAVDGNYAWVYLGFTNNWAQGGVNEKGLCFDWVAGGGPYGWKEDPAKENFAGNLSEEMLRTCANVEEAIAFYQRYNEKHLDGGVSFIADKQGNSIVVGWKDGKLMIREGRGQSHTCGFGKTAVDRTLQQLDGGFHIGQLANALSNASQVGTYPSQYSNIICLSEGKIVLFQKRNYDQFIEIDFANKLKEEKTEYMIADLFNEENEFSHVKLVNESSEQKEHDRLIEKVETSLSGGASFEGERFWTLEERMKHYRVPGLSLAVIKDHRVVWAKAYGVMDRQSNDPITTNTLFQCASISKALTAAASLHLSEKGVFDLDTDVNRYLKNWQLPDSELTRNEKVTLRRLLGHRSGIGVRSFAGYSVDQKVPSLLEVLAGSGPANSEAVQVQTVPGSKYQYSGGGYCILQQMMIDAEQMSFDEIMNQTLLRPLGMNHCTFQQPIPEARKGEVAVGHRPDGAAVRGKFHTYPEMAAAGLYATPRELAQFFIEASLAYQGKSEWLSKGMAQQMLHLPNGADHGLGIISRERGGEVYLSHDGWTEGFCSEAIIHRDRGYGVVVLTNGNHPWLIREVFTSVARAYDWDHYAMPQLKKLPITQQHIEQMTGNYNYVQSKAEFEIRSKEGHLFISDDQGDSFELFRVGQDRFACHRFNNLVNYVLVEPSGTEQIHFQKPWDPSPHPTNVARKRIK